MNDEVYFRQINTEVFYKLILSWLYDIIMSRMSFRVNLQSVVCLNVKELLAWSKHHIWSLSDSSEIRTHNHLVCKQTLSHLAKLASLAKWLSVRLWVRVQLPTPSNLHNLKNKCERMPPKTITYRSYKNFAQKNVSKIHQIRLSSRWGLQLNFSLKM